MASSPNVSSRRAQIQGALDQARLTPGKEPFDLDRFLQLYDASLDVGGGAVSPVQAERYEEEYYLLAKQVKTLAEFAVYRRELALNDAN